MVHLTVVLTPHSEDFAGELRGLLQKQRDMSRAEPGCLHFEVFQSASQPTKFVLHERWESQAALDAHRTAEAFRTVYEPLVIPNVDRMALACDLVD